ncbi:hypothetical protein B0J11DRAFT_464982 [Dendryphion nanum]|uniref:protein S-acyltransferase n=1 Tax=Dendryphion nanum TaxID=256645 RepID=A0A9P9DPQ9_9PLEO|nr:hypothetical protein B0J11DRAFT_464982 [Dendryphion nanum]
MSTNTGCTTDMDLNSLISSMIAVINAADATIDVLKRTWILQLRPQYLENAIFEIKNFSNTINVVQKTVTDTDHQLNDDNKVRLADNLARAQNRLVTFTDSLIHLLDNEHSVETHYAFRNNQTQVNKLVREMKSIEAYLLAFLYVVVSQIVPDLPVPVQVPSLSQPNYVDSSVIPTALSPDYTSPDIDIKHTQKDLEVVRRNQLGHVCSTSCSCTRPLQIKASTPYKLRRLFGSMHLTVTENRHLHQSSRKGIARDTEYQNHGSTHIRYFLPTWLLHRSIEVRGEWKSPPLSTSWTLTLPRVIPWWVWNILYPAIIDGSVEDLTRQMITYKIKPSDINPIGETIFQNCLDWRKGELCAMLVGKGMDLTRQGRFNSTLGQNAWLRWLWSGEDYHERSNSSFHSLINLREFRRRGIKELGFNGLHLRILDLAPPTPSLPEYNPSWLHGKDCFGLTPLHWAAMQNQPMTVEQLLDWGANINARCSSGGTPLWWAAYKGSVESLHALLKAGADVSLLGEDGTNALLACSTHKNALDMALPLLEQGIDANNRAKSTLRNSFMKTKDQKLAFVLMDYMTDWEAVDINGYSALFLAVWENNPEIVKVLRDRGVRLNRSDNEGCNILHHTAWFGGLEVMEILKNARIVGLPMDEESVACYWRYFEVDRNYYFVGQRMDEAYEKAAFQALLDSVVPKELGRVGKGDENDEEKKGIWNEESLSVCEIAVSSSDDSNKAQNEDEDEEWTTGGNNGDEKSNTETKRLIESYDFPVYKKDVER